MKRIVTTGLAILLAPVAIAAQDLSAREWNSPRARALAEHATTVRGEQLADSGLRTYKAQGRGYLVFLAQLGDGFTEPPKIVRTDQVASDIYWAAPNHSKQLIKGRRDTLLLPTDINYHKDHLGIVQNNFPSIIRIGDGDEVSDVPHPLSSAGLAAYDFALADSLQIVLGPRTLNVFELQFRPKDPSAARAVGSVYVDRESGAVVRMALGFTRAALRDKELEDISVILENGLIEGRFWLPRRQEVQIRRSGTWLDYPARGIIRGRWDISDYDVNVPVGPVFDGGPEIEAAPGSRITRGGEVTSPGFTFSGNLLDSLPSDVRSFASTDVAKLQSQARALIQARAIERARGVALNGRSVSDFVHVDRVEGIAVGAGVTLHPAPRVSLGGGADYGFSDKDFKPHVSLGYTSPGGLGLSLSAYRVLHDASIVPERSGLINSFAAQEFGSDYTDLYTARGGMLTLSLPPGGTVRPSFELALEDQGMAQVNARPATGHYEPAAAATAVREGRATLRLEMPALTLPGGIDASANVAVSAIHDRVKPLGDFPESYGMGVITASATRPFGTNTLALSFLGAGITNARVIPEQTLISIGGPVTAPGYDFHEFSGRRAIATRAEWRVKVPFVPVPLGGWGRAPATLTLAPYAHTAWIDGAGWRPSVGVGALTVFDLLRFDVARGVRDGRWSFYVDVSRDFWKVL